MEGEGSVDPSDAEFELTTEDSEGSDSDYEKVYVYPDGYNSTFTVTENLPGGWKITDISCEMGGDDTYSVDGNSVVLTIDPDSSLTCTFTNTAIAELVVIKNVINDNGETMTANQFNIEVANEGDLLPVVGSENGESLELTPGTYLVVESENPSYNATYSDECSGTIALGEQKTCTITNDDIEREDGTTSGSEADGGNDEGSVLGASVDTESDNGQTGSVLGASCPLPTFEQLITIKNGVGADPEIVKPVQEWLNSTMDAGLTVNGVYDEATRFAVMLFQEKYSDTLTPWGNIKATGNIWLTTAAKMLEVAGCGTVELPELVPFNS